jgi:purine-binding chemotaxis protein CheW
MSKKMERELPPETKEEVEQKIEDISNYKDEIYEREDPKGKTLQLVVFRLSGEWYGVEITKVKEVIKVGKIAYLPSSPEHIAGIINLRGYILSVTDLKTIFSLPREERTEKARIIAIESGALETGLLVDEVVESVEVPVSKIELALLTIPVEGAKYLDGQCKLNDKLIALINVEKVLERRA